MKLTKNRLKEIIEEVIEEQKQLNEVDFEKLKIPGQVNRFLNKFIDALKGANLNKMKQVAVLYKVIEALGLDVRQLVVYIQKIKKEM